MTWQRPLEISCVAMARTAMKMSGGSRIVEHLNVRLLARSYPREWVRGILERMELQSKRVRDLSAEALMYHVIALGLFMAVSTGEVLRCLVEGLQRLESGAAEGGRQDSDLPNAEPFGGRNPSRRSGRKAHNFWLKKESLEAFTGTFAWSPLTEALWTCPTPGRTWLASGGKTRAGDRRLFRNCALPASVNAGRTRSSPCGSGYTRLMRSLWRRAWSASSSRECFVWPTGCIPISRSEKRPDPPRRHFFGGFEATPNCP